MLRTHGLESFFLRKANLIKEQRASLFGTYLLSNWMDPGHIPIPIPKARIFHFALSSSSSFIPIMDHRQSYLSYINPFTSYSWWGTHTFNDCIQPASQPVLRTSIYLLVIYPNRVLSPRPPTYPTYLAPSTSVFPTYLAFTPNRRIHPHSVIQHRGRTTLPVYMQTPGGPERGLPFPPSSLSHLSQMLSLSPIIMSAIPFTLHCHVMQACHIE